MTPISGKDKLRNGDNQNTLQPRAILLGLINAVLPGLGYVFIPSRRIFGWLLFVSTLLSLIARRWGFQTSQLITQTGGAARIEFLSIILITIAFGVDAYLQARTQE